MSIRIKILVVLLLTFLTLLGTFYAIVQQFFLQNAVHTEENGTEQDIARLLAALDAQIISMDSIVGDWAPWDDTYEFIISGNPDFIESNITNAVFTNLGVELMLFINNSGQIVFGKMIDHDSGSELPVPEVLYNQSQVGSRLFSHKNPTDKMAGILALPEGAMIIASHPIVTSQGEGPIHGTLIMGRRLNESDIAELSQLTQLSISVFPYNDHDLTDDVILAQKSLNDAKPMFVAPLSETIISGYALVNDVYGDPAVVFRIDIPREGYAQAKMSLRNMGMALLAIGIILCLATMFMLERIIIVRLTGLNSSVEKIGTPGIASSRVEASGDDEIFTLATSVNSMLDSLENSRAKERENEAKYQSLFNNAEVGMFRTRVDGSEILDMNEKFITLFGYTRAEMLGSSSVLHWADPLEREEMMRRLETEERIIDFECGMLNKQGEVRRCITSIRLYHEQGILEGSIMDITERKQAEQALRRSENEMHALFAAMTGVVIVYDADGRYISIAPTNPINLYRPPDDMLGKTVHDVLPKEQADYLVAKIGEAIQTGEVVVGEYSLQIGGKEIWFTCSISQLSENTAILVAFDFTERKQAEKIREAILRIAQAAITSEGIDYLYPTIHSILGGLIPVENFFIALYDPANGLISFPYYVDQFDEPPLGPTPIQGLTGYVIRTGLPLLAPQETFDRLVQQGEVEEIGTTSVDWMGVPLKVEGRIIGVIAVQSYKPEIHFEQDDLNLLEFVSTQVAQAIERTRLEEEIHSLSITDELTGLHNRRGFTLLAVQELKLAQRYKRSGLLLFGDLDNLKTINDTWGHAQGDQALKDVGAVLKETMRETDIAARLGGDEFVVLAVGATMENADTIEKHIQDALEKRNQQGDQCYRLSLSIGIAHFDPEAPCTVNDLIARADELMYCQKSARKEKK